jgi:hypothetical protein
MLIAVEMEQLPERELLWLKEPGVPEAETLHLIAFATFGVIVGAKIIAKILAVEMAVAINRVTLIIHVIAHSHL